MASFNKVNMSLDDIIKNDRGERKNLQVVKSGRGGPRNFNGNSNRNFNNTRPIRQRRNNMDQNPRNNKVFNQSYGNEERINRNPMGNRRRNRGVFNEGPRMNRNNMNVDQPLRQGRFRNNFNDNNGNNNNNQGRRFRNFNNFENANNNGQQQQVGIFNIL